MSDSPRSNDRNRRIARRHRVLAHGKLLIGDDEAPVSCVVRDISLTGAKLIVSTKVVLPREFHLEAGEGQLTFLSRVMWRRGPLVGVAFETYSIQMKNACADQQSSAKGPDEPILSSGGPP